MSPIDYVPIMNAFYEGQGFPPYQWSVYETSPWTPFEKPLEKCRVCLYASGQVSRKDQPPFDTLSYNDLSYREIPKDTPVEELVINDDYYDHTDADKDINCIFPIERFRELERGGYIGELAPMTISGPSGRLYKRTALQQEVVPEIVGKMKKGGVDIVFLIAACVLDHQTTGLAARVIEEMGIPTIYVGVARDIMLQVKPPRAVFLDFPFGHNIGKPFDGELQMSIIKDAFNALKTIKEPGTLIDLPYDWGQRFDFDLSALLGR